MYFSILREHNNYNNCNACFSFVSIISIFPVNIVMLLYFSMMCVQAQMVVYFVI